MRVFASRNYYEVVGAAGGSVLVHGTQMDVMAACLGTGATWRQLERGPSLDSDLDFALPAEFSDLRAKLLSFKERV